MWESRRRYRTIAISQNGLATINCIELLNARGESGSEDLIIVAPFESRKSEIVRVLDVYKPSASVEWVERVDWAIRTPRLIRSPIFRFQGWGWAVQTLLRKPSLMHGTEVLASSLWPGGYQSRLVQLIPYSRVIAVDEGATAPSIASEYPSLRWFTAYDLDPEKIWRKNNYSVTRRLIEGAEVTNSAWFVGQPRGTGRQLELAEYLAIVATAISDYGVTDYFPHPMEEAETLERVGALGLEVKKPAAPLVLHPIAVGLPQHIVGISSAAVANFKILYGDAVACTLLAPTNFLSGPLKSWYERIVNLDVKVHPVRSVPDI